MFPFQSDVLSIENCLKRMRGIYKKNDQELRRQTLNLYTIDFTILQTKQRIDRVQGITFDADDECLDRLMELEKQYLDKKRSFQSLLSDTALIEEDLKRLNNYFNQDQLDLEKLQNVLKEKILLCESGEKKIQSDKLLNQERLVEENFLKLKVRQLEKMLKGHQEKIVNMDRFKSDVEKAVSQRLRELKTQIQVLTEKRKHLNEFRQKLKQELSEQSVKLEVLKKRFNLVTDLLTRDDQGEVLTGSQMKIKAAQEKQILLDTGNKLNAKVLQAEKDIKAMENTLRVVNYSNDNYRRNTLFNGQDNSNLLKELENLQEKYNSSIARFKSQQAGIILKSDQLSVLNSQLEAQTGELDRVAKTTLDHNDILMRLQKEVLDQKLKHQRAEREMKVAQKKVRQKISDPELMELIERDLLAKELQEQNTRALQQMADLVDANPDMMGCVAQHLYEKGLSMPMGGSSNGRVKSQPHSYRSDKSGQIAEKQEQFHQEGASISSFSHQPPSVVMIDFPTSSNCTSTKEQIYRKSGGLKLTGN